MKEQDLPEPSLERIERSPRKTSEQISRKLGSHILNPTRPRDQHEQTPLRKERLATIIVNNQKIEFNISQLSDEQPQTPFIPVYSPNDGVTKYLLISSEQAAILKAPKNQATGIDAVNNRFSKNAQISLVDTK